MLLPRWQLWLVHGPLLDVAQRIPITIHTHHPQTHMHERPIPHDVGHVVDHEDALARLDVKNLVHGGVGVPLHDLCCCCWGGCLGGVSMVCTVSRLLAVWAGGCLTQ